MCGIFGIYNYKESKSVNRKDIINGLSALSHRGPDGQGLYLHNTIGIGHKRLSIIDLETGYQPIANEDNTIFIICNGEIYNYIQIRNDLVLKGHVFRTKSDSETILHLYEEEGDLCLKSINGIFSFAIWDSIKNKLFLVRDRLGVKPFFYYYTKEGISFSSEIKSFLRLPGFSKELCPNAMSDFFSLGYILNPKTIFKNVYSLPPGYFLEVVNNKSTLKEYWDLEASQYKQDNLQELTQILEKRISSSVKMQLVSDVPVGAFLSGGLDSSTVTYFMKRLLPDSEVMTFSVGFKEKTYSELDYAAIVANKLLTSHKQLIVDPPSIDCVKRLVWYNDEPFADTSCVPMFFVSELASKNVKVVLSGDGGDENFAGYETYLADRLAKYYKHVFPSFIRNILRKISFLIPVTFKKVSFDYKLRRFTEGAGFDSLKAHYWWRLIFTPDEQKMLFSSKLKDSIGSYDSLDVFRGYFNKAEGMSDFQKLSYVDYKTWLVDDILRKVDRCSMAHSLEARVPLLDHTLVELAINIPDRLKIHRGITKYILKRSMRGKLSKKIIWRRKSGFNAPVSNWVNGNLRALVSDYLSESRLNSLGYLNGSYVKYILNQHFTKKADNGIKIWCLLNFVVWYEIFIQDKCKTSVSQN